MAFASQALTKFIVLLSLSCFTWQAHEASANNDTDRVALLEFKKGISHDPDGVFNSWNDSLHFCSWPGVLCGRGSNSRVTSLFLPDLNLAGTLPPHIGNLSFLTSISLANNRFYGQIPSQIGNLVRLQQLNLSENTFDGAIPVNLSRCSKLKILSLQINRLIGTIPDELGSLAKLEYLRVGTNNLTGKLPPSLGNLSQLANLGAAFNNLAGRIPDSFGQLSKLRSLTMGINQLSGKIPPSIYNLSSLQNMVFTYNNLEGSLPENLGHTLTNINYFEISGNNLVGTIPESFCNASKLVDMNMNSNNFVGRIPNCLGNFGGLLWLDVGNNSLGHNSTGDFDFVASLVNCSQLRRVGISRNNFGGSLPDSVGNLSSTQFSELLVGVNQISALPDSLQNLMGLAYVDLSLNMLSGTIPSYFGKMQNVQGLILHGNDFSGEIPDSLGNLSRLVELDLSTNRLEGTLPASLGNCQSLAFIHVAENGLSGDIPPEVMSLSSLTTLLNLSVNLFSGKLPKEVGKLVNLNALDVSYNNLTGEIPSSIGECSSLEHLFMQGNSFEGTIPAPLASMKTLQELDLSHNKLTGNIPAELQNVKFFQYLNLSFNDLEGEVPSGGIFSNASAISLMGNPQLCGGVIQLQLPKCSTAKPAAAASASGRVKLRVEIALPVSAFILLIFLALVLIHKYKTSRKKRSIEDAIPDQFMRVSYGDLHKATDGFSAANLLGSGGFGTVYKGKLEHMENPVAVKVLDLKHDQADKSLAAECNALRNIRHRNLVKVVSFCSSLDHKGKEFKALVFEYMENGSLEDWLYGTTSITSDIVNQATNNLSLIQRLNIAIDVASAMHYLHNLCETPIIHCDLKPSNVLLDRHMVGHVSDFGQARFLSNGEPFSHSTATTSGVKGTIGYAAPEYGMGSNVSARGDVYSYGILVLEMFTRRRPTDEMFREGLNLHSLAKAASPGNLGSILDPVLLSEEVVPYDDGGIGKGKVTRKKRIGVLQMERVHGCLVSILEVGVACSSESPGQRMNMAAAAAKLQSIRDMLRR
ncbi:unnamed protein product [Linum tenue]|uniref:non-specific serine/threonine protein kinase n=1 Tax=Linum tenue TaxID=586396 RepID=A0AAV0JMI2_9ROSI|nr:unnamed protein product [Linum tenue]